MRELIILPTGNETISMLKDDFAGDRRLRGGERACSTTTASNIYAANYQTIALLITISIWYLAITSVLYVGQYYVERRFARGASRELPADRRWPEDRVRRDPDRSATIRLALQGHSDARSPRRRRRDDARRRWMPGRGVLRKRFGRARSRCVGIDARGRPRRR